ncbi:MAG TPA: glycerol-3-phosphate dehydrogenase/oxidase [Chromatiales bacterium]|nr:glycerol-3-phosphate dehydrogenase/oxidase [Chromatiales bacterium]
MLLDVLVIGAGIQGVGIAQAAAAAGYSVQVLEQYPQVATGSSSRSTKLIHGGLRYLESNQFSLVRECLLERRYLLRNAPHLVRLVPFLIPVYRHSMRPAWMIRAGLTFYALLGSLRREARFCKIPRRDWKNLDGLEQDGLVAVYQYYDAQTDDAALTAAVMQSALDLGAQLITSATVERIDLSAANPAVSYHRAGTRDCVEARVVINATGPWVGQIVAGVTPAQVVPKIDLVQGTHIIVPGRLSDRIYYVEAPSDRRAVFILPWGEHTMVGTTESHFQGDPAQVQAKDSEVQYLLDTLAQHFPERGVDVAQIIDKFAGLRVLPGDSGNANRKSRDTVLQLDSVAQPRLISVLGGKLTAYRAMAQMVLGEARRSLPPVTPIVDTRYMRLPDVDHCEIKPFRPFAV